jgi:hypothetical protein
MSAFHQFNGWYRESHRTDWGRKRQFTEFPLSGQKRPLIDGS